MQKESFQLYLNTQDPKAQNISPPTVIQGTCSVSAGSPVLTILTVTPTMCNSLGQPVYYSPLDYGTRITIAGLAQNPIYIQTQISGVTGGGGTYYMSYTPPVSLTGVAYTGLQPTNSFRWLVDWDALFQRKNHYCSRVRVGARLESQDTLGFRTSQFAEPTPIFTSNLTCNLASPAVGSTVPYTTLGICDFTPYYIPNIAWASDAPSYYCGLLSLNTMKNRLEKPIVYTPVGTQFFNLNLSVWNGFEQWNTYETIDTNWVVLLQFELLDENDRVS